MKIIWEPSDIRAGLIVRQEQPAPNDKGYAVYEYLICEDGNDGDAVFWLAAMRTGGLDGAFTRDYLATLLTERNFKPRGSE